MMRLIALNVILHSGIRVEAKTPFTAEDGLGRKFLGRKAAREPVSDELQLFDRKRPHLACGDKELVEATAEAEVEAEVELDLGDMTIDQLKAFAEDNHIDLEGKTRKADILAVIQAGAKGDEII